MSTLTARFRGDMLMVGKLLRWLMWSVLVFIILMLAIPLWEKASSSYGRVEGWLATLPYISWIPGWLTIILVIFGGGALVDFLLLLVILSRFKHAAEIKIFQSPNDHAQFEMALIVGERTDEDGEFYACNIFLDIWPPKMLTEYIRKDQENIRFIRTGRDPREHLWDIITCRIKVNKSRKKQK